MPISNKKPIALKPIHVEYLKGSIKLPMVVFMIHNTAHIQVLNLRVTYVSSVPRADYVKMLLGVQITQHCSNHLV